MIIRQMVLGHGRINMRLRTLSAVSMLFAVGILVSSFGCATPYQERGFLGGYDDYRITDDTFEVKFAGNGYTKPEQVRKYLLRRAAEVTLLHHFAHFLSLGQADESSYMTMYSSTGQAHAYGTYPNAHAYGSSTGYGTTIRKPATFMRIKCYKVPPPGLGDTVDARKFLEYNFPEALAEWDSEHTVAVTQPDGPGGKD